MTKVAIIGTGPCGLSMLRSFEQAEKKGEKIPHPWDHRGQRAVLQRCGFLLFSGDENRPEHFSSICQLAHFRG